MVVHSKGMTAEEFAQLPQDDTFQELIRGEVRTSPPPAGPHGRTASKIHLAFAPFVEAHGLGVVFIETGYRVERAPDTVLAPDLSFVRADRLAALEGPATYADLVPDLVVEVISPSESRREADQRMRDWLRFGARLGWAANPRTRTLTVYRPEAEPRVLGLEETLDGGDVLPGFFCPVRNLFA